MEVKRFIAPNMREGLKQVKESLGDDAIIVSKRPLDKGVEIIAGLSIEPHLSHLSKNAQVLIQAQSKNRYDEFLDTYKKYQVDPQTSDNRSSFVADDSNEQKAIEAPEPAPKPEPKKAKKKAPKVRIEDVYSSDDVLNTVHNELSAIKTILSSQASDLVWQHFGLSNPYHIQVIKQMIAHGFEQQVAQQLVEDKELPSDLASSSAKAIEWIIDKTLEQVNPVSFEGKRLAIVGVGGAGKTKSLTKLIPLVLQNVEQTKIGLIAMDENRLGQFDELMVLGHVFGIETLCAHDFATMDACLARFEDKDCILMDITTCDLDSLQNTLKVLKALPYQIEPIGCLSATMEQPSLDNIIEILKSYEINQTMFTKADETSLRAKIFNQIIKHDLSLNYLFDSPLMTQVAQSVDAQQLNQYLRGLYDTTE